MLCGGREAVLPFPQDPAIRWTDLYGNLLTDADTLPGTMRYAEGALTADELAQRLMHWGEMKDTKESTIIRPFLSEIMGHT